VIIPERDAPVMLGEALASLAAAFSEFAEPGQIVVVANGAAPSTYDEVKARFPAVEWVHSEPPLGFAEAVEHGLARVRFGATYLMNNDMTLDARALAALLPLRGERVFAIGSQIAQRSASGRREETGFTDWYVNRDGVHLYHAPPPPETGPQLCASGGAALFRTDLLARYLPASRAYDPFYWEDVEWSVRAWRDGFDVLFCPDSRVAHRHRATTARFYEAVELARIVERNRLLFDMRHAASGAPASWLLARACELPYASQRELARLPQAASMLRMRVARSRSPQPRPPPRTVAARGAARLTSSYSFTLGAPERTRILFVTPFAVFPPRHGGARRVAELIRGHKHAYAVALLGDEASLYDARSFADFDGLAEVRLVQRDDTSRANAVDLATRTREHCHPVLVDATLDAIRALDPNVVVVEHAELAPLVRRRAPGPRWVLDLHDAYGPADFANDEDARRFAADLAAYDAVVVCSEEDRALLAHPRVVCVPNGAQVHGHEYRASRPAHLLFVGPFRYRPNRDGIVRFLREAWPSVRAAVPSVTLTILGGDESADAPREEPLLAQPGVRVLGHRDDVPALLEACTLAVNPLSGIRGSALKLVEALAAGRVCITTEDGARGFAAGAPAGLVTVRSVADMAAPIVELLQDDSRRHRLEACDAALLDTYDWHHSVMRQRALFDEILQS